MNGENAATVAVIIPAYRPTAGMVELVAALSLKAIPAIVIVDDGSGPEYLEVFDRAAAYPNVQLLRHAVNLGKGAALKTGINHALCAFPELVGVVTADADGQHLPDDIERIVCSLLAHPHSLVLGSRSFVGAVPPRSRIGNAATSVLMHALLGRKLMDTQTGLRGIPTSLLPQLLRLEAAGYEFELEMLIAAHRLSAPILEEPIQTIYEPGNKSSHFNPLIDSMKIYFVLLRFISVSLVTSVLDNLVFYVAFRQSGHVLLSQVLGRAIAVGFHYSAVRGSVFYSRQQHRRVLPKYLLLLVASGSVSYAGIRLLSGWAGFGVMPAKLIVETILFFINFTIQRMFIFEPRNDAPGRAAFRRRREPDGPVAVGAFSWLIVAVLASLVGVEAYAFATGHLFLQRIWDPVGLTRFAKYAGVYLALIVPLLLLAPWTFAGLITALVLMLTSVAVGPQAVLAVAFFLVASAALGSRLCGRTRVDSLAKQLCAVLLGIGVYIFLMTWMARLPVNYPAVWGALLAIPILLDLRGTGQRLATWWRRLASAELRPFAERATFALLVFVLMAQWFAATKPEASADGLSTHLAVPANIAVNHVMTFHPSRFIWAVMPMGADFTYSIVYLLGGEYAARLLNFSMLLMVVALLYCAVRRWVTRAAAFLLLAMFAATPMVQLVTGDLLVENLLAALVLGTMTAIWLLGDARDRRFLYIAAALGGSALAVKVGSLAFVAVALPFLVMGARRVWKSRGLKPWLAGLVAGVLFLTAALPTYLIAWRMTGNPLFPFLNTRFHSPLLDPSIDLADTRFQQPLTWATPFDLTFHSSQWYEGQRGSFGFQYMVLAPLALLAILVLRRRPAVSAGIVALGAAAIILRTQPNARYVYAAMPLLTVPFAALLGWALAHQRWLYRALIACAVLGTVLNVCFLPSSSYYHKDFCLRMPFSRAERQRYVGQTAPIREVIAYFNRTHPRAPVLLTSESDIAGLSGEVYENHWHQMNTYARIDRVRNVPEMLGLLASWKVRYLIVRQPDPGQVISPEALQNLLTRCTTTEFEFRRFYLARVEPTCREPLPVPPPPELRPPTVVSRGTYDDFDPALGFRGNWEHNDSFRGPYRHTISFSARTGDEAALAFDGTSVTYVFTQAYNRGLAAITIDGTRKADLDLYSPKVKWQSRVKFSNLSSGRHLLLIRVLGTRNPRSTGQFVDVDGFAVE